MLSQPWGSPAAICIFRWAYFQISLFFTLKAVWARRQRAAAVLRRRRALCGASITCETDSEPLSPENVGRGHAIGRVMSVTYGSPTPEPEEAEEAEPASGMASPTTRLLRAVESDAPVDADLF